MSVIEKFIEQLPYGDGAIRRRFIVGLIFVSLFFTHQYVIYLSQVAPTIKMPDLSQLNGFTPKELLNSSQSLVVVALIIFVVGSIIDAMIEGFIVRGVSITLAALNWVFNYGESWNVNNRQLRHADLLHTIFRGSWMAFTILWSFFTWPLAIIISTILNSAGFNNLYKIGLIDEKRGKKLLSNDADKFYRTQFPKNMRDGLDELYGDQSGSAWQLLMDFVPETHRLWVSRLNARNRDLASFIASAMLALFISIAVNYVLINQVNPCMLLITYCVECVLAYLLFGCAAIVRRSTVSVLELIAATE